MPYYAQKIAKGMTAEPFMVKTDYFEGEIQIIFKVEDASKKGADATIALGISKNQKGIPDFAIFWEKK